MKKRMNELVFWFLIFCLSFPLVSAGAVLDNEYNLSISCSGFNCSNINVTILYPNSSVMIDNQLMINKSYYALYSLTPKTNGQYDFYYSDGTNSSTGYFIVTTTGNEFNSSQAILYFLIDLLLIFLFLGSLYAALGIPFENTKSVKDGEILKVNWKKYLKIAMFGFAWMFLIALIFVTWTLIYAYAQWKTLGIFFYYLYRLLMVLTMLIVPVGFVFGVIHYINDKRIDKGIKKGVPMYK